MHNVSSVCDGQVDASGHPGLTGLHQQRRNQAQAGGLVGKDTHHPRAATYLPIQAFHHVGGPNTILMRLGKVEHGQALRLVGLHPGGQFRRPLLALLYRFGQVALGRGPARHHRRTAGGCVGGRLAGVDAGGVEVRGQLFKPGKKRGRKMRGMTCE